MITRELASRGAQIVLLTQHELSDPFLADFVLDLRAETNNELITAETVDLSSLHSIRLFATKWVDNAPPRRLDAIILCANTMTPAGGKPVMTSDGVESNWGINYLANFHLLSILSPALRAQPPDRDVRIIFGMCSSYMGGSLDHIPPPEPQAETTTKKSKSASRGQRVTKAVPFSPSLAYATSKFALLTFAKAFQKHLDVYQRPDKHPMNSRVIMVDPGWTRTPGMRRYLTVGSLWGLMAYLVMWPLWWLVLKSPEQGAQSFLFAIMEAELGRTGGGKMIKECRAVNMLRPDADDESLQKALWEESERTVEIAEKESAIKRAKVKKEHEESARAEKEAEGAKAADNAHESKAKLEKQPGSRKSRKKA